MLREVKRESSRWPEGIKKKGEKEDQQQKNQEAEIQIKQKRPVNRKREKGEGTAKDTHSTKHCPKERRTGWCTWLCHRLQLSDSYKG